MSDDLRATPGRTWEWSGRAWSALAPVAAGTAIGFFASGIDIASEQYGVTLGAIGSSSTGWGIAALACALFYREVRTSVAAAVATLMVGVVTYYSWILLVSRRWQLGAPGSRSSYAGLASVGHAVALWTVCAIFSGVVIGALAYVIPRGGRNASTLAAGALFGLLSGQGVYTLIWAEFVWIGPLGSFVWLRVLSACVQLLLLSSAFTLLLRRVRSGLEWRIFWPALVIFGATGALGWWLLESVTNSL